MRVVNGGSLFDRIGKTLRPNAEGRALLPRAAALVADARSIEQQTQVVGLRLAASQTIGNYVLPRLLARHAATEPSQPSVASHVRVANTTEVAHAVARLECDVGFIEGLCHDPMLQIRPWAEDELVIVAARKDARTHGPRGTDGSVHVSRAALSHAVWLMREPGSGTREAVEHALSPHLGVLHAGIEFGSPEAIQRAAAAGLGLACLSRWVVQDLLVDGSLVVLRPPWPPMRRMFSILTHGRQRSPAVARFLAFCTSPDAFS